MLTLFGSLLLIATSSVQSRPAQSWDDPFQGARFSSVPASAVALGSKDCDGVKYNKCAFVAFVDFDGDGRRDRVYMANAGSNGLIAVNFANNRRKPMVVATFRGRLAGDSYISKDRTDPTTIVFIQPETSMAKIRLIAGRPKMIWLGD